MPSILLYKALEKKEDYSFASPLASWLIEKHPGIPFFELDTNSDPTLFGYANEFISKSDEIILLLDVNSFASKTGELIMSALKKKALIISTSSHPLLNKVKNQIEIKIAKQEGWNPLITQKLNEW